MSASNGSIPPSTTLYVKNISSKIKKPEVRRQLHCLFISYGKVIDVIQMRRNGLRGQAHIVFRDLASSTAALRALDGFIFYEKPLNISYAAGKSKATLVAERGPEALFDPDLLNKSSNKKTTFSSAGAELQGRERKRAREEAGVKVFNSDVDSEGEEEEEEEREKEEKGDGSPEVKKVKLDNEANDEEEEMQMADSDDDT